MTRKRSDKNKSQFFGDHLEIKPAFLQRPKSLDEVMSEVFSKPPLPTSSVEPGATVVSVTPAVETTAAQSATQAIESSVALSATVELTATVLEIPLRLQAEVARLKAVMEEEWQTVSISSGPDYWHGYSEAWHWLEDRLLPHLEKDLKLTLRRCYRKAFGSPAAGGRFFCGQTALAREVGLSKRRIQDILEIFHLLGWVRKIAHHNRGGRKGTDYEMRLPPQADRIFQLESNKP